MLDEDEDDALIFVMVDTTFASKAMSVHTQARAGAGMGWGVGGVGGVFELGSCLPGQLYEGSVGQFPCVSGRRRRRRCS